jgi:acyl-CoA reductase-like NAD-dependent aldehyde dehydrogenase
LETAKSFIDGRWLDLKGRRIKKLNPANGKPVHEVRAASSSEIRSAVESSKAAFRVWRRTPIDSRAEVLSRVARLLADRIDDLSKIITIENGKPILESNMEVMGAQLYLEYYANESERLLQDEKTIVNFPQAGNYELRTVFEPLGVVAVISPWNWPLLIPCQTVIPAIIAGNSVVFKPSSLTPMVGQKLVELFEESGLPRGVLNLVQGDGTVGDLLVRSDVNSVVFVGGTDTGRKVATHCAKGLKRIMLELGGCDPFVVFDDAYLEEAVNGAVYGRFFSAGQVCVSSKRILVQEKIFDEFVQQFSQKASSLRVGDGMDASTDVGPLISKGQQTSVARAVKQAVSAGAKVLCGGDIPRNLDEGYFYSPTVLTNVDTSMNVMRREIFGPVAPVIPFEDEDEAVRIANSTRYGLGASIWTNNQERAMRLSKNVEAGIVWINDVAVTFPQAPWGGVKESGIGRHSSRYGLLEMVNIKQVCINLIREAKRPWWLPYGG